jgi:hypothetical protein
MQYAHWLMVAGAVLVVLAFIGPALHKNAAGTAVGHLTRDTASETVQAALSSASSAPRTTSYIVVRLSFVNAP